MLAPLIDDKQKITLIEDSGVQFLDFGLRLPALQARRQFVRQTANGPLLRLNVDGNSGKFLLYPLDGGAAEVVRPETDIALADSLTLLAGQWLPLPVLRCSSGRRFIGGPDNWALCALRRSASPTRRAIPIASPSPSIRAWWPTRTAVSSWG